MKQRLEFLKITDEQLGNRIRNGCNLLASFAVVFVTAYVLLAETLERVNDFFEVAVAGWTGVDLLFSQQEQPELAMIAAPAMTVAESPVPSEPEVLSFVEDKQEPVKNKRPAKRSRSNGFG